MAEARSVRAMVMVKSDWVLSLSMRKPLEGLGAGMWHHLISTFQVLLWFSVEGGLGAGDMVAATAVAQAAVRMATEVS